MVNLVRLLVETVFITQYKSTGQRSIEQRNAQDKEDK